MVTVTTDFDSGGGCDISVDGTTVSITLTDPHHSEVGYFHIRLDGVAGETVTFSIENLADSNMEPAHRLAHTDDIDSLDWARMDDDIDGGASHTFDSGTVYVSSLTAYPYSNTVDLVTEAAADYPNLVETEVIGQSYEGRDMHAMRISDPDVADADKQDFVITTRQHPGEIGGSWHMEAIADYVLNVFADPVRDFEDDFIFHFIPHCNPDGIYRGNIRHDSQGNNLNRQWQTSGPVEVDNIKSYIQSNTTDLYRWGLDLHTAYPSNYGGAATYHPDAPNTDSELSTLDAIAAHSMSLSGKSDMVSDSWKSGWMHTEFGIIDVTTETWMFYDYSTEQFREEGEGFVSEVAPIPEVTATKFVRQGGKWIAQS